MDNDSEIVRLLTEIRDNQQRQMETHEKSQQNYRDFYREMQARQLRRGIIAGIVVGIGMALVLWGTR